MQMGHFGGEGASGAFCLLPLHSVLGDNCWKGLQLGFLQTVPLCPTRPEGGGWGTLDLALQPVLANGTSEI